VDTILTERHYNSPVPKNQRHPTPEELDERVKLDLDTELAIKLVLETGEHPEAPESKDR
jgi:hypothetical protein